MSEATPTAPTNADVLAAHAVQYKLTPGQQVTLLLYYLAIRLMFPEITLDQFLVRSRQIVGATKENRQFPKDAIDHHCPNKDSQWEPKDRLKIMLTFLNLCDILGPTEQLSLDAFLEMEAPVFKSTETPAALVAPGPTVATPPKVKRPAKVAPSPVLELVTGKPAIFRGPLGEGGMIGPEQAGVITDVQVTPEGTTVSFQTSDGELLQGVSPQHLQPARVVASTTAGATVATPPPAAAGAETPAESLAAETPAVTAATAPALATGALRISKSDGARIMSWIGLGAPVANVEIGGVLAQFQHEIPGVGPATLQVVNGQPHPFVDAYVLPADGVPIANLPPREHSIVGEYRFELGSGIYVLNVTINT